MSDPNTIGSAANPYVEFPFEQIVSVNWGGGVGLLTVSAPGRGETLQCTDPVSPLIYGGGGPELDGDPAVPISMYVSIFVDPTVNYYGLAPGLVPAALYQPQRWLFLGSRKTGTWEITPAGPLLWTVWAQSFPGAHFLSYVPALSTLPPQPFVFPLEYSLESDRDGPQPLLDHRPSFAEWQPLALHAFFVYYLVGDIQYAIAYSQQGARSNPIFEQYFLLNFSQGKQFALSVPAFSSSFEPPPDAVLTFAKYGTGGAGFVIGSDGTVTTTDTAALIQTRTSPFGESNTWTIGSGGFSP